MIEESPDHLSLWKLLLYTAGVSSGSRSINIPNQHRNFIEEDAQQAIYVSVIFIHLLNLLNSTIFHMWFSLNRIIANQSSWCIFTLNSLFPQKPYTAHKQHHRQPSSHLSVGDKERWMTFIFLKRTEETLVSDPGAWCHCL